MNRRLGPWMASAVLALAPVGVQAQWAVDFRRPGAVLGAAYNAIWRSDLTDSSDGLAREWLRVDFGASLRRTGSPVGLSLRASVGPQIGQRWANPNPSGQSLDQKGLTGNAVLSFVPGGNITTSGRVGASSRFQPEPYGGYQQSDSREWGGEFIDRNPLLPMSLSYSDRDESEVFASGVALSALTVDRRVRELNYQATNWKTQLFFRQREVDEVALGRARGYLHRTARASNTQRWGKGSQLRNQFSYFSRAREREFSSLAATSSVHLQQTERFSTTLDGSKAWTSGEGWKGSRALLQARVEYRMPAGTFARVETTRTSERLAEFSRVDIRVTPQVNFRHVFGPRTTFEANVLAAHTWTRRDRGAGSFVFVLDERHIFGPDAQIRLDRPFVDASSLVLVTSGGIQLDEGFDYRLQEEPPYLLVVLIPGGRIQEGTEVVADYRYQVPAQSGARYLNLRGAATLRAGGLSLLYRRDLRDGLGDPGAEAEGVPSLVNVDNHQVGLQYDFSRGRFQVAAYTGMEWMRTDQFEGSRLTQSLSVTSRLTRTIGASIRGRSSRSTGGSELATAEARVGLQWRPVTALQSELFGSYFTWDDELRSDRLASAGSAIQYQRDRTSVSLRVELIRRSSTRERTDRRIALRFQQAFR